MFFHRDNSLPLQVESASLAVRCSAITKEFGVGPTRVQVLRGVDLEVPLGQITFLVGPSGCGKTTLISVIAGLLTPNSGELAVLGQSLRRMRGSRLVDFRCKNIGFIFQQFNLLPTLTAAENAAIPLIAEGLGFGRAVARAKELLGRLGMEAQVHRYPRELSGGQQQRVAIARALVHNPRLVVCDEPTASLDAQTGQTVMGLLRELALAPERAVIVVTHDDRIYGYADRIAEMADGLITEVRDTRGSFATATGDEL